MHNIRLTENEKVNRVIAEKSIRAQEMEEIKCCYCDRHFARMNIAKHLALAHSSPTKVVHKKKAISNKRKMVKNDSENEQFYEDDYFIETKPSEIIKKDGCKSCDKKPRRIEYLVKKLNNGSGYILPDEKTQATKVS